MQIQYYSTLKKVASDNRIVPQVLDWTESPNEWHFGPTGTGKVCTCRCLEGEWINCISCIVDYDLIFVKMINQ